jgi:hypothetical protein
MALLAAHVGHGEHARPGVHLHPVEHGDASLAAERGRRFEHLHAPPAGRELDGRGEPAEAAPHHVRVSHRPGERGSPRETGTARDR